MVHSSERQRKVGRIAAVMLIALAATYAVIGANIEYSFSSDPIGPRGFPVGLGVALGLFGLWYFAVPGESETWPAARGRIAALSFLVLSVISVLGMDWIGFVPAMAILLGGIARLFGAGWLLAALNGIGQALLWWLVFGPLLGGNLPKGPLGF
jgi:putative tricarboxylic transport membrane protein